ncbi:MAG: PrsW family intramembrane metalloprotease [Ignavibacteriae bacterium]|nr:PrsW family intramembrane metalloprotease [Ignavibacteriota bacterium]
MILISLIMAVAPAVLILLYYYKQDKAKPEPKGLIIKIFFIGFASIIPAIIIELILDAVAEAILFLPIIYFFIKSFVVAGLVEESLKLFVVKQFAYKDSHFDEVMDGVVYAVVASMGFACFENVLYVSGGGWTLAFLRAFTAVPLHAVASGIMGFYIGKAKFAQTKSDETSLIFKGLLIAVLIHGAYDFFLFSMPVLGDAVGLLAIPIIIGSFLFLRKKIKLAISEDVMEGRTTEEYNMERLIPLTGTELNFSKMSRSELYRHLEMERMHSRMFGISQPKPFKEELDKEIGTSTSDVKEIDDVDNNNKI